MELVDRQRRRAVLAIGARRGSRGVEPDVLLQHLCLDIADGRGEVALFLVDVAKLLVQLLADIVHLGNHLLNGFFENRLGGEGVAHGCGGAMGLAAGAAAEGLGLGKDR